MNMDPEGYLRMCISLWAMVGRGARLGFWLLNLTPDTCEPWRGYLPVGFGSMTVSCYSSRLAFPLFEGHVS